MTVHSADSKAQREAENEIRRLLNEQHGWKLAPSKIPLNDKAHVQVDGIDRECKVAVEIVARIGDRSASRDKKMASDGLKLHLVASLLGRDYRLLLVGCDSDFIEQFQADKSRKWQAFALAQLGVEVVFIALDEQARERIRLAQESQGRANVKR